jgi:hypothetical protein
MTMGGPTDLRFPIRRITPREGLVKLSRGGGAYSS